DRAEPDQPFVIPGPRRLEPQRLGRRIMALQLARRLDRRACGLHADAKLLRCEGASAQQPRPLALDADDGRLDADRRAAAVEDERDSPCQACQHMLGPGWAD